MDREKVIVEIEDALSGNLAQAGHVYKLSLNGLKDKALIDALALLKEQEEKKGQWIPIESPTGVEAFGVKEMTVMNVRCSVCGSEEDVSFTGYKYCPRCGAKMEGR